MKAYKVVWYVNWYGEWNGGEWRESDLYTTKKKAEAEVARLKNIIDVDYWDDIEIVEVNIK